MNLHDDLSRLLAGDLEPREADALRERIANEPDVARVWTEIQMLSTDLASLPGFVVPPALDRAVLDRMDRTEPLPRWPLVAAAALLAGVLIPRPAPQLAIDAGSQTIDGRADVRAAGVEMHIDGRARVTVEPDRAVARENGAEGSMNSITTIVATLVTVTVYEGTARIADGNIIAAGETRSLQAAPTRSAEPAVAPTDGGAADGIRWSSDEASALAIAQTQNRPVLIAFRADWCRVCKKLASDTYTNPDVIAASDRMVPVMIDATDGTDPRVKALLDKYDISAVPTVKFLRPDGHAIDDLTITTFVSADEFVPRMEKAIRGEG